MHRFITLVLSVAITFLVITSMSNIYKELSETILFNNELVPPPNTHYGGIILDSDISYGYGHLGENIPTLKPKKIHISLEDFKKTAEINHLKYFISNLAFEDIKKLKTPFIIQTKDNYLLSVKEFGEADDEDKILLTDPYYGKVLLKDTALKSIWNSSVLIIEKESDL